MEFDQLPSNQSYLFSLTFWSVAFWLFWSLAYRSVIFISIYFYQFYFVLLFQSVDHKIQNINLNFRSFFYFKTVYENHPSKIFAFVLSALTVAITSPIIYFTLVWNRNLNYQTLLCQIHSSFGWVGLGWNLIAQPGINVINILHL